MYKIYTSPGTGGFAAECMLEAGTAAWQRVSLDTAAGDQKQTGYIKLNPAGQVPALQLPGGQVITESAAICIYLGDAYPKVNLAPDISSAARAVFLRWTVYMSSTAYSADLRYYYAARFTTDPSGVDAVKAQAVEDMNASFALLNQQLQDRQWLAGPAMTAADLYLLMLACWHPDAAYIPTHCDNVAKLCDRVKQRDFTQRANAFHKLW